MARVERAVISRLAKIGCCSILVLCLAGDLLAAMPDGPVDFSALRDDFPAVGVIAEGDRACIRLDTLLAASREQRARGLMFVRQMPADAGMIFIYREQRSLSMWMKNTLIPLDIVFADQQGVIINIATKTVPLSLKSIRSTAPAAMVLELNDGQAAKFGLGAGHQLHVHAL